MLLLTVLLEHASYYLLLLWRKKNMLPCVLGEGGEGEDGGEELKPGMQLQQVGTSLLATAIGLWAEHEPVKILDSLFSIYALVSLPKGRTVACLRHVWQQGTSYLGGRFNLSIGSKLCWGLEPWQPNSSGWRLMA